jgi:hypothetical protein
MPSSEVRMGECGFSATERLGSGFTMIAQMPKFAFG